ncbi:MAG: CDP-alcohol phosphatidyltransferase family protein [Peptostreptococcaceae bacterium]|nr:CDP-alcohol phosphatidyltransferase family protein [Peptostreptococcaceae bacterium]
MSRETAKRTLAPYKRRIKFLTVNALTLSRFFLTIRFIELLQKNSRSLAHFLLIFVAVILSDFCDGRLARRWHVESRAGSVLDVAMDFFFIFATSLALYQKDIFPIWMIGIIFAKTVEFILTSRLLKRKSAPSGEGYFVFDWIGRCAAICFYFLPIIAIGFQFVFGKEKMIVFQIPIFLFVLLAALISSAQRITLCLNRSFEIN